MLGHQILTTTLVLFTFGSNVASALPQDRERFNAKGEYLGGRGTAHVASLDHPDIDSELETANVNSVELVERAIIPPVPEDLANFVSWVGAIGAVGGCIAAVTWVGRTGFFKFTSQVCSVPEPIPCSGS